MMSGIVCILMMSGVVCFDDVRNSMYFDDVRNSMFLMISGTVCILVRNISNPKGDYKHTEDVHQRSMTSVYSGELGRGCNQL